MYTVNQSVNEVFYIKDIKEGKTNNGKGKPFLSLIICNKESELEAKYWDADLVRVNCRQGDYAMIQGQTSSFNGNIQLTIQQLQKTEPVDLMRESNLSTELLQQKTDALIEQYVPAQSLAAKLWQRFINNTELYELYRKAPAAVIHHHNYKRGLWVHSVSVSEIAAPLFAEEERGIGVVAALLHDIGKVRSHVFVGPAPTLSNSGKLLGHIVLGVMELMPLLDGFPEEFKTIFLNCLCSHHGKLEFGSPVVPQTRMAVIIHQSDMLDSRAQHLTDLTLWHGWSGYNRMLGTELYAASGVEF